MDSFFEQAQRFTELWTRYAAKMASVGMAYDPTAAPPEVARQLRGSTFQAMSQYAEEFMRSPEFLAMMKQSLDASLSFRKQLNDFLTSVQHNAQGVARQDIDSLMLSVRHMETRVLNGMEQLSARLDDIGKRLTALEKNGHAARPVAPEPKAAAPETKAPPPAEAAAAPPAKAATPPSRKQGKRSKDKEEANKGQE